MTGWLQGRYTGEIRQARRRACRALLIACLAWPGTGLAEPVTLNLKDADINALVTSISEITGKNFIVDPRVKGKVSVISSRPMDDKEIYEVFLSILAVHGFAAIEGANAVKIVPLAEAKQESIPTLDRLGGADQDQMVTRVVQVKNVSASQLVPMLRPLIPPQGHLASYAPTNVLIISDRAANAERIAGIIQRVDLASNEQVEIVPLRHASASEVVRTLTALEQNRTQGDPAAAAPPQLVADERTNSLLMSGDSVTRLRLRTLAAHLDTPLEGGGNTQVIYLRYAKAVDLVPVLQGVSKELTEGQGEAPVPAGRAAFIDIQADDATNALVVTAPPESLRSLKRVIAQLDVRRAQVMVEAAIAEISKEKQAELGVQWVVDGSQGGNAVGFTNFSIGTSLGNLARSAIDIAEGNASTLQIPEGLNLGVGQFGGSVQFAAIISALAADTDTNILSTPTLVTLDNEEAEIVVGENRAFLTGSFTTTADGASNPFQTIERRDVGLTLKIKPQINEGNAVQLQIAQDVEDVIAVNATGPVTTKRSIKTNVLVEDGQILVLGGLIDDTLSESVQKVPGLGDIPLVGNLFRYRKTEKGKRNLMIFLHPVILRDALTGTMVTNDKYSYIRDQQIAARQRGVALLPEAQTPLLTPQYQVRRQGSLVDLRQFNSDTTPPAPPPSAIPPPQPPPAAPAPPPQAAEEPTGRGFGNK